MLWTGLLIGLIVGFFIGVGILGYMLIKGNFKPTRPW